MYVLISFLSLAPISWNVIWLYLSLSNRLYVCVNLAALMGYMKILKLKVIDILWKRWKRFFEEFCKRIGVRLPINLSQILIWILRSKKINWIELHLMKPFSNSIMFFNLYGTELAHLKSKSKYGSRGTISYSTGHQN